MLFRSAAMRGRPTACSSFPIYGSRLAAPPLFSASLAARVSPSSWPLCRAAYGVSCCALKPSQQRGALEGQSPWLGCASRSDEDLLSCQLSQGPYVYEATLASSSICTSRLFARCFSIVGVKCGRSNSSSSTSRNRRHSRRSPFCLWPPGRLSANSHSQAFARSLLCGSGR